MTAPSRRPRPAQRRLPRRVYWVRRLVLLAVLAVVVGTAYGAVGALAGAWSQDAEPDVAATASAGVSPPSAGPSPSGRPAEGEEGEDAEDTDGRRGNASTSAGSERSGTRAARERLAEPDGVCPDSDVRVRPRVDGARLNEPIRIVLEVSTAATPACTWEVGPDSVFLKVTRRTEDSEVQVWSSQQCPGLMPTAQVVARAARAAEVVVSWSGRKSDPECTTTAGWVHAGPFRAVAIARGAVTPLEEDFLIAEPAPQVVVEPSPEPSDEASNEASDEASNEAGDEPGGEPSEGTTSEDRGQR